MRGPYQYIQLVTLHKDTGPITSKDGGLLGFAVRSKPISSIILDGLSDTSYLDGGGGINSVVAIPEEWGVEASVSGPKIIRYNGYVPLCFNDIQSAEGNSWLVISNGRFAAEVDSILLTEMLAGTCADVVVVNVKSELRSRQEKVRLTTTGTVAGFQQLYSDSVEPTAIFDDWPHHIFISSTVSNRLFVAQILPKSFFDFVRMCRSQKLTMRAFNIGGITFDLEMEDGLLNFFKTRLTRLSRHRLLKNGFGAWSSRPSGFLKCFLKGSKTSDGATISQSSRLVGKVLLGKDVYVGPEAVVIGPSAIADNVKIESGAVIHSSIIGPGVRIPQNQFVQNRVIKGQQGDWKQSSVQTQMPGQEPFVNSIRKKDFSSDRTSAVYLSRHFSRGAFYSWPKFSYVRCLKRIADCFAALLVLILFAPIIPFIALAIKLNSPGLVFFKDRRQGLHGKEFNCLKFRTMMVGADKIQDKLRIVNQIDGPQFKIDDDPRISAVGRFLRDTYLDEIPQFFNVLLGQMSVVGPRPSPEAENTLCPSWRDARLSVRPGITGLWQVCRTRQPMRDFQEWIYYDTRYVRSLSPKLDLWICLQTAKKLVKNFVSQF